MSELQHVHIKDESARKDWDKWMLKSVPLRCTSNTALIYSNGFFHKDYYLLIALVKEAHELYREKQWVLSRFADIAEKFRSKF